MQESQNMQGALYLALVDDAGQVVYERRYQNRIVTSGRRLVAEMFAGRPDNKVPARVSQIAVGDGGGAVADGNSALVNQRIAKDITQVEYVVVQDASSGAERVRVTLRAELTKEEGNGAQPLREAGILNEDGVLYNRVVFEDVTKTDRFRLMLMWEVTF